MRIHLQKANGLPAADSNGKSDPYCKLTLHKKSVKSKTVYKTLSPVWDEHFDFSGTWAQFSGPEGMLKIACWDHDLWDPDDLLGEAHVHLGTDELHETGRQQFEVPVPLTAHSLCH